MRNITFMRMKMTLWISAACWVCSCVPTSTEPPVADLPVPVEVARLRVGDSIPVVLARDLDGDGVDELVVANAYAGAYPRTEAGDIRLFSRPQGSGDWAELPALLLLRGQQPFHRFGSTLAAADLDDDGVADLVLRADPASTAQGMVCVVSGTLRGEHALESAAYLTLTGPATLGHALTCLDYNGDGIDDLLLSCPLRSQIYVVLGPRTGHLQLPDDADATLFTESGALGWTMASGDLDGDGVLDVLLAEPVSETVYVVPVGMIGVHRVEDIALAVIRSVDPADDVISADALAALGDQAARALVRTRRTDEVGTGTIFVLNGPLSGEIELRRDADLTIRYVAPVLGASAARVQVAADIGPPMLAIGTAGRSHLPATANKGGVWLLPDDVRGSLSLDAMHLQGIGWELRPHDVDLDWLGRDVLTGRLSDAQADNLILTAKGAVLVFGWH